MLKSSSQFLAVVLLSVVCAPLQNGNAQSGQPTPAVPAPAPAASAPAPSSAPAAALAPVQAVSPTPAAPVKNPVKPTAESQAKAKSLYQIDCAICHGDNGNGKTDVAKSMELTMDDWSNSKSLAGKDDWQLFNVIRTGKDKMPSEPEGRAKDTDVWNLIIYIRSFSKGQSQASAAPAQ